MRETEVSRFVAATPLEVERALTPVDIVSYEGSFDVFDVEEGDRTRVTAGGAGLRMALEFERREDELHYEQVGEEGPFEAMWTRISWSPENEGTRVTARSAVSLGLPLGAVTDRIAAWKRRGELKRALGGLAEDLE